MQPTARAIVTALRLMPTVSRTRVPSERKWLMPWTLRNGLVLAALSLAAPTISGQGTPTLVPGTEFAASTNMVGREVRFEARLFVPTSVTQVRAVMVFVSYGTTWQLYESTAWRRAAESVGSALLLAGPNFVDAERLGLDGNIWRDVSLGGGDGLLAVVRQLATDSRHPELLNAPLAFWGWSAAGNFGATFAKQYPERTLAFIRYHSQQRPFPVDLNVTKGIPALLLAGGKDTTERVEDAETLARSGRALGAPWTFVIEPNVPHGIIDGKAGIEFFTNSGDLMIPWLTAVVRQRAPQAGTPMRPIGDDVGWIGDNKTGEVWSAVGFSGSRADNTWLPDEPSARGWQRIRVAENPGRPIQ
jgi:hypothetical protein